LLTLHWLLVLAEDVLIARLTSPSVAYAFHRSTMASIEVAGPRASSTGAPRRARGAVVALATHARQLRHLRLRDGRIEGVQLDLGSASPRPRHVTVDADLGHLAGGQRCSNR